MPHPKSIFFVICRDSKRFGALFFFFYFFLKSDVELMGVGWAGLRVVQWGKVGLGAVGLGGPFCLHFFRVFFSFFF